MRGWINLRALAHPLRLFEVIHFGPMKMSNTITPQDIGILNPNTPLAFLPPPIAHELEIYRYVVVSALNVCHGILLRLSSNSDNRYGGQVYTWNFFANTQAHYKLLFCQKIKLSAIAYFISMFVGRRSCFMLWPLTWGILNSLGTFLNIVGCVVFHSK